MVRSSYRGVLIGAAGALGALVSAAAHAGSITFAPGATDNPPASAAGHFSLDLSSDAAGLALFSLWSSTGEPESINLGAAGPNFDPFSPENNGCEHVPEALQKVVAPGPASTGARARGGGLFEVWPASGDAPGGSPMNLTAFGNGGGGSSASGGGGGGGGAASGGSTHPPPQAAGGQSAAAEPSLPSWMLRWHLATLDGGGDFTMLAAQQQRHALRGDRHDRPAAADDRTNILTVPLPPALWMGLAGLAGALLLRRRGII